MMALLLAPAVAGCPPPPPEASEATGDPSSESSGTTSGTTTSPPLTTDTTGTAALGTGDGTGTGDTSPGLDTSTSTSTGPGTGTGSGETDEGTGTLLVVGCADGEREWLLDELQFPLIAACSGGFGVPGVTENSPMCDRQGGDDGPFPDGMTCSIDDLCAEGWHVCTDRLEVSRAGIGHCNDLGWINNEFFATAQSGEGSNTCSNTGANDVFGCGDNGYTMISSCEPLNRSTSNLCEDIQGPWNCSADAYNEAGTLTKTGPINGGALCCRDGI